MGCDLIISQCRSNHIRLLVVYAVPNLSADKLCSLTNILACQIEGFCGTRVICGDFNLPKIDWKWCAALDHKHSIFVDFCMQYGLSQYVMEPTRLNHILDLVLANKLNIVHNVKVGQPCVSDHNIVSFNLNVSSRSHRGATATVSRYDFVLADYNGMSLALKAVNWSAFFVYCRSVNDFWLKWLEYIMTLVNCYVPLRTVRSAECKMTRLPNYVRNLVARRNTAWREFRAGSRSVELYKRLRARCKAALRRHLKSVESRVFLSRKPKRFFAFVGNKINPKSNVYKLQNVDGSFATSGVALANIFSNEFRGNYCSEKVHSMPVFPSRTTNVCGDPCFDRPTVYAALVSTNDSAAGPDLLPGKFYRMLATELTPALTIIFQQSFLSGTVPDMWRVAAVTPLHKKGVKDLAGNYRPISLTCIACKVMERIIRDVIMQHLTVSDLLSPSQHGFRDKRSTLTSLIISQYDYITQLDNGSDIDLILFDFSKAFDSVNHELLLLKLRAYGINSRLLAWIAQFLSNRRQYVSVQSAISDPVYLPSGVIQGSVLGPTLFTIYINDIPDVISFANLQLFADDLKLWRSIKCLSDRINVQTDIHAVYEWSCKWLLPLSFDKLMYMHIGARYGDFCYMCGASQVKSVNQVKDLGVTYTSTLSCRPHYDIVRKKAHGLCAMIYKSFECRDASFLTRLFCSYVRPVLEYSSPLWSPHMKVDTSSLERVQRLYTKRIPSLRGMSYDERLNAVGLKTLEHRRLVLDLLFMYKIVHNLCAVKLSDLAISPVSCSVRIRNRGYGLHATIPVSSLSLYAFEHRVCKLWNALPAKALCLSLNRFRHYVNGLDLVDIYRSGHVK